MGIRHSLATVRGTNKRPEIAVGTSRGQTIPQYRVAVLRTYTQLGAVRAKPSVKYQSVSVEGHDMINTGHIQFRR